MSEPSVIRLERHLPFPPAEVWRALTEPELLARWWAAGDMRPVVGHEFALDMGPFGQQHCRVFAVEPERMLAYSFGEGMLDTTIAWRLTPDDGGTLLSFEHSGFDLDTELGRAAFGGMGAGWPGILARIESALVEA